MNNRPNPYVGPRSFQPGEPFYGRDRELRSLSALLIAERIVLLHSPSGAGKSSLVQAGLLPRLIDEEFNVLPTIRLNQEPPAEIASLPGINRYILSAMISMEEGIPESGRLLLNELAPLTLDDYLTRRFRAENAPVSEVLVFDQFEEVLTIAPADREAKQAFFEQLGLALRNKQRWALFAIREDYLGALAPYTRPIPGRFAATFRLDLLGVDGALQAIQKPPQSQDVEFRTSAAKKLVDDLRRIQVQLPDGSLEEQLGQYVEPVQLQVVCFRLWQGLAENDNDINETDLAGVGDVNQSLADYYSTSVKNVAEKSGAGERSIREWFDRQLITPEGIRGQVLMGAESSDGLPNPVVSLLENAHIIRGEKRAGKTWYELSHDRMLKPVRENNTAWFGQHLNLLQRQAMLWGQQGRSEGLLLRGKALSEAENDLDVAQLLPEEKDFLEACRKLREREQRDRRRNTLMTVLAIGATIAMLVAGVFYFQAQASATEAQKTSEQNAQLAQENANVAAVAQAAEQDALAAQANAETSAREAEEQAKISAIGELAALAIAQKDTRYDLSALLGLEGYKALPNSRTSSVLLTLADMNLWLDSYIYEQSDSISSVKFSPDGGMFASGSWDNTIILWDAQTHQAIGNPLKGHTDKISGVAFSPNGDILASASWDNTIILWDVKSQKPLGVPLAGHSDHVTSVAFAPDGNSLASGSDDRSTILWDIRDPSAPTMITKLSVDLGEVTSVAFNPDSTLLASGNLYESITLWNISDIQNPTTLTSFSVSGLVSSVAFSPNGAWLAAGSQYDLVYIWDLNSLEIVAELEQGAGNSVLSLAFNPDSTKLASSGVDNTILLWDLNDINNPTKDELTGSNSGVMSVDFSPDGEHLVSGSIDKAIILWNLDTPKVPSRLATLPGTDVPFSSVDFSPDGNYLAAGNYFKNEVLLWDAKTYQRIGESLLGHTGFVYSVDFSPDSKILASGDDYGFFILWDVQSQTQLATIQALTYNQGPYPNPIYNLAFSPDGKYLALGGFPFTISLWDVSDPKMPKIISAWDEHTYRESRIRTGVTGLAFSPDGKTLISGATDMTIKLWDIHDPQEPKLITTLNGHTDAVLAIAISPDGTLLASGGEDNTIIIWDVKTFKLLATLRGHRNAITGIAFHPDGKSIISSSRDHSAILWDISNLDFPSQFARLLDVNWLNAVDFSPDGMQLAGSGDSKRVIVWNFDPDAWFENTCQRVGRNFTRVEWEQYGFTEPYRATCPQWPLEPIVP